ncbi:hypothetical protein ACX27_14725 [Nostoc piscinale CENA21]|uniref:Uncharacterized protein n=1 Tax=Nostoc piscinale CENA21 TaxID=224013 RepID=A0A0M3V5K3_9NOSO|nr:hypothetical protein ACX27_14725 [Nostoc piscinale CENA21]
MAGPANRPLPAGVGLPGGLLLGGAIGGTGSAKVTGAGVIVGSNADEPRVPALEFGVGGGLALDGLGVWVGDFVVGVGCSHAGLRFVILGSEGSAVGGRCLNKSR